VIGKISIRNFILIDEAQIDFSRGFTAITGETGAGKSVFLNALSALLGGRIDAKWLRNESSKAVLELEYFSHSQQLMAFLEKHQLDNTLPIIIRREILPGGKSRAFLNDSPIGLPILKEFGDLCIEMHEQGSTGRLFEQAFQTELLDAFAHQIETLNVYKHTYKQWKAGLAHLELLKEQLRTQVAERDYLNFQVEEIKALQLHTWDVEGMKEKLQLAENSEKLKSLLASIQQLLETDEWNAIRNLQQAQQLLQQAGKYTQSLQEPANRLQSALLEIKDIASELNELGEKWDFNEEDLLSLQEKNDALNRLLFKHKMNEASELISFCSKMESKLQHSDALESQIQEQSVQMESLYAECLTLAQKLYEGRTAYAPKLKEQLELTFKELGLKHAEIQIAVNYSAQLSNTGNSSCEWLFKANKTGGFEPLRKVASGGELSRVMLAITYHLAENSDTEVVVLDEIDTGVSGEIAQKMGKMMKQLSAKLQVLSVTHLPQVAALSDSHLRIVKHHTEQSTASQIQILNSEERIQELAKMLSGATISAAAIQNAKDLLAYS
jgi:DNA repair protein RecN (Recombination protein N)